MAVRRSFLVSSIAVAAVPAAAWALLATRSPTSTHHFAPLVVAVAPLVFLQTAGRCEIDVGAAVGAAVGLGATGALAVSDRLRGPTFIHTRPSWPELVLVVVIGAAGAWIWHRRATDAAAR